MKKNKEKNLKLLNWIRIICVLLTCILVFVKEYEAIKEMQHIDDKLSLALEPPFFIISLLILLVVEWYIFTNIKRIISNGIGVHNALTSLLTVFICVLYPLVLNNSLSLEEALTSGAILAGVIVVIEIANIVIEDYRW